MLKITLFIFLGFIITQAFAGRPVFHTLTRSDLIAQSDFIFSGWPSPQPANAVSEKCPAETGRWQIHKVYKGDSKLEGKIISIAEHRYEIFMNKVGKGPSYAANVYKNGELNREATSSVLFTNRKKDGCFELTANGAQEHRFQE